MYWRPGRTVCCSFQLSPSRLLGAMAAAGAPIHHGGCGVPVGEMRMQPPLASDTPASNKVRRRFIAGLLPRAEAAERERERHGRAPNEQYRWYRPAVGGPFSL